MAKYTVKFQEPADTPALARLAERLQPTRYASWPLEVEWARALPGAPENDAFCVRRRRLLLYEQTEVRALHNFFEHEMYIAGLPHPFVWVNGPLSESVVNQRYALSWLMLLEKSLALQPLHLGGGPPHILDFLARRGWSRGGTFPRFLLPVRPAKVLREMSWFQSSRGRQFAARLLAGSGLGSCLGFLLSGRKRIASSENFQTEEWDHFGPWADRIWRNVHRQYQAVARRDAATMNRLYRPGDTRFRRFLVRQADREVGWFLTTTQLRPTSDVDLGFGNLRVAAVVDTFCGLQDATDLMRQAVRAAVAEDVDLIYGHWSHQTWQDACTRTGFFRLPTKFPFAVAPAGKGLLFTPTLPVAAIHFTDSDNDGPYYVVPDRNRQDQPALMNSWRAELRKEPG